MKIDLRTRWALAIFAVCSFALVSNLIFFGREAKHYTSPYTPDELAYYDPWNELAKYQHRFERVRVKLDPNQVVGYVSDTPSSTHFTFTQYVLAPVVMEMNTSHRIVVGNFKRGTIPIEVRTNAQLVLVADLGNGVALFRTRRK
jgi:hypothetical protein